jgi:GTP cyclohydrolase III
MAYSCIGIAIRNPMLRSKRSQEKVRQRLSANSASTPIDAESVAEAAVEEEDENGE